MGWSISGRGQEVWRSGGGIEESHVVVMKEDGSVEAESSPRSARDWFEASKREAGVVAVYWVRTDRYPFAPMFDKARIYRVWKRSA